MKLANGVFTAPLLEKEEWLRHSFGTRLADGDLGLPAVTLRQIHSDVVQVVDKPARGLPGDALVTAVPGLALVVRTADCLPVLLADPEHRAVAAVHAGWRGTLKRVAQKAVGVMRREFGSDPGQFLAALGPAIHACHYEVGEEVIEQYRSQFPYAEELFRYYDRGNPADTLLPRQVLVERQAFLRALETARAHLDLEEAVLRQLLEAGVPGGRIARDAPCTACRTDLLHSYRIQGRQAGRLLSRIAVLPP